MRWTLIIALICLVCGCEVIEVNKMNTVAGRRLVGDAVASCRNYEQRRAVIVYTEDYHHMIRLGDAEYSERFEKAIKDFIATNNIEALKRECLKIHEDYGKILDALKRIKARREKKKE